MIKIQQTNNLEEVIYEYELERDDCDFCASVNFNFWSLQEEKDQLSYFERYGLEEFQNRYNMGKGFNPKTWECDFCGRKTGENYTARHRLNFRNKAYPHRNEISRLSDDEIKQKIIRLEDMLKEKKEELKSFLSLPYMMRREKNESYQQVLKAEIFDLEFKSVVLNSLVG